MIVSLTSDIYTKGQMYDSASTVLAQKVSQVNGVGQVIVGGSSLPAVRVELNPLALNKYGIGLEQVRTALSGANANLPKGHFADAQHTYTIQNNDQLFKAVDYAPLIVAYHNGAPVRVGDIAQVSDSVADIRNAGFANGKPSVLIIIFRQPGANIITTVNAIKALLPELNEEIPKGITLTTIIDQTTTISASIHDVERSLVIAVFLVILVVFVFLRDFRTMLIPGVAVPVSLIGTFGVMYLCGYSLDNLSLMALTISTGFVVDDAIVVVENITRYIEQGMKPVDAALKGSAEIGFTVLSISISLIAVFTPILLMGGLIGRLFREFAVTLSVAILISMVISLTTTPMMCALLLRPEHERKRGRIYRFSENAFDRLLGSYQWLLVRVLRHPAITLLILIGLVALNVFLFYIPAEGPLPRAGHRPAQWQRARRPGHLLSVAGTAVGADAQDRESRPGRRQRRRVHRRRRWHLDQYRPALHLPQAARRPPWRYGHPDHQPPAAQAGPDSRRHAFPPALAGPAHRWPHWQCRIPIHAAGRQLRRDLALGSQAHGPS